MVLSHVNQALNQVLEIGQAHFFFLWDQLTAEQQALLHEAACLVAEGTPVTLNTLSSRLDLAKEEIASLLAALIQREILRSTGNSPPVYEFVFDLMRLWIGRHLEL